MDKHEKLTHIKECIDRIEEDVKISCRNGCPDKETLMNQNILECLKYISGVLEETVKDSDTESVPTPKPAPPLPVAPKPDYIPTPVSEYIKVTPMADKINEAYNGKAKVNPTHITNWLLENDILTLNEYGYRIPSQAGRQLGIMCKGGSEKSRPENRYSENMQKLVYENIENIIVFAGNRFSAVKLGIRPENKPFSITDEQKKQLQVNDNETSNNIANEINRVTQDNNAQKINGNWIVNWLTGIGAIETDDDGKKNVTRYGEKIGIILQPDIQDNGTVYERYLLSADTQKIIYDNIESIVSYNYEQFRRFKSNK